MEEAVNADESNVFIAMGPDMQTRCPKCHETFWTPRTEQSDIHIDYWCPLCDYQYAHWPKVAG
jgi:hypothetical protein